jgi:hypothetical protein
MVASRPPSATARIALAAPPRAALTAAPPVASRYRADLFGPFLIVVVVTWRAPVRLPAAGLRGSPSRC